MRFATSLLFGALLLGACGGQRAPVFELNGSTMGTSFSIKLPAMPPDVDPQDLQSSVESLLAEIELSMSTYRIESEISRFNASESTDWQPVSGDLCRAAEQSLEISRLSSGAFDITVGPLVNLWGFGPDGDVRSPPSESDIAAARKRVGFKHLETDCSIPAIRKNVADLYLDLSAYAKGLAVDKVAEVLDQLQTPDYLVEIGGEMKLKGHNADREKWAVAIEEPLTGERRIHSIYRLTDVSVATSGDYRNFFESNGVHYSHTIDSKTGRPVTHKLASVTVVAETAAFADAMATALLALGPDEGMALASREDIATLFLLHGTSGFEERMSPAFAAMDGKQ